MARSGSGTYNLPAGNPVAFGTTIDHQWANLTMNDIRDALTQSVSKDGQTVWTGQMNAGSFKLTNLAQSTANGDALSHGANATVGNLTINGTASGVGSGLTSLNASNLSSGTVPLGRLADIANAQIATSAAIAWTKLDKSGSSLADLTTRSAADLTSGILPDARFPATLPAASGANLTNVDAASLGGSAAALYALLASPTFTGVPAAPTASPGTNTTQLATTAFVTAAAFSSALPSQAGNAGKFVTTNGTTASWDFARPNWTLEASSTTLVNGDAKAVRTNSASLTMTLPATPAAGDVVYIMDADYNAVNFNIIIGRNGQTIMGLAEDMTVSNNGASFTLTFVNGSWRLS